MLSRLSRKKLRTGSWPLAGILRCGECTKPLYGQLPSGTRSRAIYACKKGHVGISAGLLEQYLIKESVRRAYEARKYRANNPPAPTRAEDWPHFSELSETSQLIAEATAAWRDRTLPPNIAFAQIRELEPKQDELQKQLDAFLAVQSAPKETPLKTVGQVLEWLMEMQGPFLRETPGQLETWQKPGPVFGTPEPRPVRPRDSEESKDKKERPQELPYAATPEETEELNRLLRGELEMVVIRKGKAGRQSEEQFKARIDPVWRG